MSGEPCQLNLTLIERSQVICERCHQTIEPNTYHTPLLINDEYAQCLIFEEQAFQYLSWHFKSVLEFTIDDGVD